MGGGSVDYTVLWLEDICKFTAGSPFQTIGQLKGLLRLSEGGYGSRSHEDPNSLVWFRRTLHPGCAGLGWRL